MSFLTCFEMMRKLF